MKLKGELFNHLGNVLAVVSDRLTASTSDGANVDEFKAEIMSATDYFNFGASMVGRTMSSSSYRYGFNGQEKTTELGAGHSTALYWEYEGRLGRRWNIDPVIKQSESPYACLINSPISATDQDGDDAEKINEPFDKMKNFIKDASNKHEQENNKVGGEVGANLNNKGLLSSRDLSNNSSYNNVAEKLSKFKVGGGWKIGLLNGPRRWWKKNIGWFDKGAHWRWRRNAHTHNYFFGAASINFKLKYQRWEEVVDQDGQGTGGTDVNYTVGQATGSRYAGQFKITLTHDRGVPYTESQNGGPFQTPPNYIVGADGVARDGSGLRWTGFYGIIVARNAGFNYRLSFNPGTNYSVRIREKVNVTKKYKIPFVGFWQEP